MPELHLTLDSADQQAAAEAVIATLYSASQPLLALTMKQLWQVVILSDRLQLTASAQQAIAALEQKLSTVQQTPQAVIDTISNLQAWPSCLLPVVPAIAKAWPQDKADDTGLGQPAPLQRMLLAVFGRLNDVWADKQLREVLMKLPLSAMQLLLSADQLVVDSEDTVLYTAAHYVAAEPGQRHSIRRTLADVIRCPWLSTCCLAAAALGEGHDSDDEEVEGSRVLLDHKPQLRQLLSLRLGGAHRITQRVQEFISAAPASWLLRSRPHQDNPAVSVTWQLTVDDLQKACKRCCDKQRNQTLKGPVTPPKAGLGWQASIICDYHKWRGHSAVSLGYMLQPLACRRESLFGSSMRPVSGWSPERLGL